MRFVSPDTGAEEVVVAEHQLEYLPLPVALYATPDGVPMRLIRVAFNTEERKKLAEGEDVYICLLGGGPMTPISVQVGPEGWTVPEEQRKG